MIDKINRFIERRTRHAWSAALTVGAVTAVALLALSLPDINILFVLTLAIVLGGGFGLFVDWRAMRRRKDLSEEWAWVGGARVTDFRGVMLVVRLGRDGRYRCEMAVGGRITTWPVGYADTEPEAKRYLVAVASAMVDAAGDCGIEFL